MIKSFRHKGLRLFFETQSKAGIQPHHAPRLRVLLGQLDVATGPEDMNVSGWRLHALQGDLEGQWSVSVNGNWRMVFQFQDTHAVLVDYLDYH